MKITDTAITPISPHPGSEPFLSRQLLNSFSALHHIDPASTASSLLKVSDSVSLTVQAKLSSKQTHSTAETIAADQSATDYGSKGGEAIVQLIEMLTGIKVKLLTQADLLAEDKQRTVDAAKTAERQQPQAAPVDASTTAGDAGSSPVQTKGILKFADGKEISFSLDLALPKSGAQEVGITQKGGNLSRSGIEIYLQKNQKELPSQEHLSRKAVNVATVSETPGGVGHAGRVIGRLTIGANPAAGNHFVVSA